MEREIQNINEAKIFVILSIFINLFCIPSLFSINCKRNIEQQKQRMLFDLKKKKFITERGKGYVVKIIAL